MGVEPIFLDEKFCMGVFLVPMIEKYKEIDKKLRFLQFSRVKLMSFASCFCYDLAHSAAEHAHVLVVDTSLAT